jgi:hypothetical protein
VGLSLLKTKGKKIDRRLKKFDGGQNGISGSAA